MSIVISHPMALPSSQEEIRRAQEQRRARMSAESLRQRFAAFVSDACSDGINRLKPRVHCDRDLPPSAA